jgi:Tetratricopeptide repeat
LAGSGGNPPDFVGLARGLCERSLLTARSDRAFLLHRLSLELERRRTPRPERFLWDSRVAEVLSTVVPKDTVDVRTWPRLALLQPHALDLFTRTELLAPTTAVGAGDTHFASRLSTLLNQFGIFLHAKAEFSAAEPLLRRALAIDEESFGPEHPTVARDLNNLARLLQDTNRLPEAEPLSRRSVGIFLDFTRRTGHPHPTSTRPWRTTRGSSETWAEARRISRQSSAPYKDSRWRKARVLIARPLRHPPLVRVPAGLAYGPLPPPMLGNRCVAAPHRLTPSHPQLIPGRRP